jgi:hypothetical protein
LPIVSKEASNCFVNDHLIRRIWNVKESGRTLNYCLRINHHASDHIDLILDGVRPGILRARAECPTLAVALRVHWQHGPHLLIGVAAGCPEQEQQAVSLIGESALAWMKQNSSQPIEDIEGYRLKSLALAKAEDIAFEWNGLRPTDSISPADYAVPDFLDDPALSVIRDWFTSTVLDELFNIMELRRNSDSSALVRIAHLFLLIEQLRGPPMLDFWPMSLQAQVQATRSEMPDVFARLDTAADQLLPFLSAQMQSRTSDNTSYRQDDDFVGWLENLSALQKRIEYYVNNVGSSYFDTIEMKVLERRKQYPENKNPTPIEILARSPVHFSYRIFMNMIYLLIPAVGFSSWKRVLVGRILEKWLEINDPEVLDKVKYHAIRLIDKS